MGQARWNGAVIADSDDTVVVEGNHYFPRAAGDAGVLSESATTSLCPWKGIDHYHHVAVGGQVNRDAAWYSPDPTEAAPDTEHRIACRQRGGGGWPRAE